jgi:outer membrane protein TolC
VGVAFLDVATALRAVEAAQADLERRTTLARSARALADGQLRPGADASRAEAERALADTRAIRAAQTLALAQAAFQRWAGGRIAVDASTLLGAPAPPDASPAPSPAVHPLAKAQQAAVGSAKAQESVLSHTDRPRVLLQSSLFARGSGARTDGLLRGGLSELGLDRANWAAGVQVVFPNLFDFTALSARKTAAAASTRAELARYDEAVLAVSSRQQAATAMVQMSRAVLANMPVQREAARLTELQARARYDAGLASIVEVADAQNLLAQAEYQDEVARLDVWRALLADALARGSLDGFLAQLPAGRP